MGAAARRLDLEMPPVSAREERRASVVEARATIRHSVHVEVDLFSEHNFWSGLTMNMSEGGLFVATHHTLPLGVRVMLNMTLPTDDLEPIVAIAEVRWTRAYSEQDDIPPGLGLQFVDLDPRSLSRIRRFVTTLRTPLLFDDE